MRKLKLYVTICWWADACIQFSKDAKREQALTVNCTVGVKLPGTYRSPVGKRAFRYLQNAGSCSWEDLGENIRYGSQDDFTDVPVGWVIKEKKVRII